MPPIKKKPVNAKESIYKSVAKRVNDGSLKKDMRLVASRAKREGRIEGGNPGSDKTSFGQEMRQKSANPVRAINQVKNEADALRKGGKGNTDRSAAAKKGWATRRGGGGTSRK